MLPRYQITEINAFTHYISGPEGTDSKTYKIYAYALHLIRVDIAGYGEERQLNLPVEQLPVGVTTTFTRGGEAALDLLRDALVNRLEVTIHDLPDGRLSFSVHARPDIVWLDPATVAHPSADLTGWLGEYFDNRTLSGEPKLVRRDLEIQFDWKYGSPDPNALAADNFSARWTRTGHFVPGVYQLVFWADNSVLIQIDDQPPIGGETDPALYWSVNRYLAGAHRIRLLYYERDRLARLRFWIRRLTD